MHMIEVKKASHCAYKIRYHMVFCIKYRKKLLIDSGRINYIKFICSEIGKRYCFDFDAIGTDGDHVHIFIGAAPKYSPSKVMQIIKSITAREFFKQFPEIKKQLWGGEFWSDGGYVGTVGDGQAHGTSLPGRVQGALGSGFSCPSRALTRATARAAGP